MAIRSLAYYISAHGYGHAARSVAVLHALVGRYRLTLKTEIPAAFFRLYLPPESWTLIPQAVDTGCVQTDFLRIDPEQTFRKGEAFQKAGADRLEREIRWLKKHRIDLVLTDVPSFPVAAAAHLGLPSLVIGNFTWHDIYRHLPGAERHRPFLAALEEEYAAASLQVLPQCHVANGVIPRKKEVGFIALRGRSVRSELEPVLEGSLDNKTLVFLYFGELGEKPVAWEALTGLSDCVFVTRDQLPRNLPNLFILDDRFRYPDLVASSDLVCTKAGYSTLATAFAHGKPVLCSPRDHFHEFEIMKDYLSRHRVGRILEADRFYSGRWEEDIKKTRELTVKDKVPLNGENEVARLIEHFLGPP